MHNNVQRSSRVFNSFLKTVLMSVSQTLTQISFFIHIILNHHLIDITSNSCTIKLSGLTIIVIIKMK